MGTKKMLRPMSSPKTGSTSARLTSVKSGGLNVAGSGNAEARVALQIRLQK